MKKRIKTFIDEAILIVFESVILTLLWNCILVKITDVISIQQWQSILIIIGIDIIVLAERTRKDI
jgi:hypothetical protein